MAVTTRRKRHAVRSNQSLSDVKLRFLMVRSSLSCWTKRAFHFSYLHLCAAAIRFENQKNHVNARAHTHKHKIWISCKLPSRRQSHAPSIIPIRLLDAPPRACVCVCSQAEELFLNFYAVNTQDSLAARNSVKPWAASTVTTRAPHRPSGGGWHVWTEKRLKWIVPLTTA